MIHTLISLTSLLLTMVQPVNNYTVIEDRADLPLLNENLQNREILKLKLANGLEALIISDKGADQSAAAVRVGAGSWNDPGEYAGMAHFCEHMLFMGTAKYPDESSFMSLVSDYAGMTNAFTAPNRTVYMFSAQDNGFLPLLDRFAHFFIDPLFNPNNIAREMHAVDQEFAKNVENDAWREYMVFKETGNPNHPNRAFSTGNSQTLAKIPQEVLRSWHDEHYGADKMHLIIYSSLPIDELKKAVVETFSPVPQSGKTIVDTSEPLSSQTQVGHITFIKPIKNRQSLSLSWELPLEFSVDESKSADLVAFALGRGQRYSLYEKLKNEQLVDSCYVRLDDLGGHEHRFFSINLELTNLGIEQVERAIQHVFEAIANVQENGVPEYLFDEKNTMAKLNYQYQDRRNPFDLIVAIADSVANEDLSTYPRNTLLGVDYDPEKIETVASLLTPQSCIISLMADPDLTKVKLDKKERWMEAEYTTRPIPKEWMKNWARASINPEIQTAGPNPYIPENLALIDQDGALPLLIANDDLGQAYYVRASEFATPESVYHIHILSPQINPSPRSSVLTSLYIDHITDQLHPTLAAANAAGLTCRLSQDRSSLYLTISGYSEKAPLLLQTIAKEMTQHPPSIDQFAIYMDRHEKAYENGRKDLAARQAKELADAIVNLNISTRQEKLRALHAIAYEDFLKFHQSLFESTYSQALFAGNLKLKEAESAWLDVIHFLGKSAYPKEAHPETKIVQLPDENGPFKLNQKTNVLGNSTLLLIDEGDFTHEKRAAQDVLNGALGRAFFEELRSKQKTGYIAHAQGKEIEERLFHYFIVQSNSHQPEELLFRFEQFIETYNDSIHEEIPVKRFNTLKSSLIESLQTRFRNLSTKSALWDMLAFEKDADFEFVQKRIDALTFLEYKDFLKIADEFLNRSNRKRLAILYEGRLASPFAYQPTSLPEINEIATYAPRPLRKHLEDAPL